MGKYREREEEYGEIENNYDLSDAYDAILEEHMELLSINKQRF